MRNHVICLLIVIISLTSCGVSGGGQLHTSKKTAHVSSPTGKYRDPRMYSKANPFQGRAKARLAKSQKERFEFFTKKRKQNSRDRETKDFNSKRKYGGSRVKTSGSRSQDRGERRKNKNLFDTKKE